MICQEDKLRLAVLSLLDPIEVATLCLRLRAQTSYEVSNQTSDDCVWNAHDGAEPPITEGDDNG